MVVHPSEGLASCPVDPGVQEVLGDPVDPDDDLVDPDDDLVAPDDPGDLDDLGGQDDPEALVWVAYRAAFLVAYHQAFQEDRPFAYQDESFLEEVHSQVVLTYAHPGVAPVVLVALLASALVALLVGILVADHLRVLGSSSLVALALDRY